MPYRRGVGPTFTLVTHALGGMDWRGQSEIGYVLTQFDATGARVIFDGGDFHGSPMHADDSDASVASLLSFLTLRPGDTDAEYFDGYTDAQLAFADEHAETLSCIVYAVEEDGSTFAAEASS